MFLFYNFHLWKNLILCITCVNVTTFLLHCWIYLYTLGNMLNSFSTILLLFALKRTNVFSRQINPQRTAYSIIATTFMFYICRLQEVIKGRKIVRIFLSLSFRRCKRFTLEMWAENVMMLTYNLHITNLQPNSSKELQIALDVYPHCYGFCLSFPTFWMNSTAS